MRTRDAVVAFLRRTRTDQERIMRDDFGMDVCPADTTTRMMEYVNETGQRSKFIEMFEGRKLSGIRDLTEADVIESVRVGATYPIVLCLSEKEAAAVNRALRSEMAVWRDAVTETGTLLNDVLNRLVSATSHSSPSDAPTTDPRGESNA